MELLSDLREVPLALGLPSDFTELLLPMGLLTEDLTGAAEEGRLVSILVALLLGVADDSLLRLFLITGEDPCERNNDEKNGSIT